MKASWLYAIADALDMPLLIQKKQVIGEALKKVRFASLDMHLKPAIIASHSTDKGVAVLVKIAGDLHLVLSTDGTPAVNLWGLNAPPDTAKGLPALLSSTLPTPDDLNAALRPLCAFRYARGDATDPWGRIELDHDTADHLDLGGSLPPD